MKSDPGTRSYYVLAFPITLTIGIILIPVVPDYGDHRLASEAVSQTARWFAGHILSAVAFGLGVLSSSEVCAELRDRSYAPPAILPAFMAVGAALYAAGLGADGIAPLAVKASGSSPTVFFDGSGWWISGVFMAATLFFGGGLISLVMHVIRGHLVDGIWRYVIFVSSLVFVSAPVVPSGWALYGEALAAIGVFIPIGLSIRRSP